MLQQLAPDLGAGVRLPGGFVTGELLDERAFARVYQGTAPSSETVAIKVLKRLEAQPRKRFAREIKITKALPRSPYVVRYVHHGELATGVPFLVMEYVDGYTLQQLLRSGHVLTEQQACVLMVQLCESFAGLHQLGMTHGDIKPQNIMLDRRGRRVKLLDFGLVRDTQGLLRLLEEEHILQGSHFAENLDAGMLMGTPELMAPETIADARLVDFALAQTDTPADVFGLGVVFYELLSGRRPFPFQPRPGTSEELQQQLMAYLERRLSRAPAPPPIAGVTPALWSILAKALRHDPKRRQRDARELQSDVDRYLRSGAGIAHDVDEDTTISASFEEVRDLLARSSGVFRPPSPEEIEQAERAAALDAHNSASAQRTRGAEWWIAGAILVVWAAVMVVLAFAGLL